jgi:ubiquinone/menaquinone biosynthesis C-methylase UbiE/DNA-binding transcriptional ArsR family regulator
MVATAVPERQPEALLSWMASLADATRLRLLRLLEREELGVAPLCEILQLPQSTVSRHLKVLGDEGFVQSRAQGTNRLYRMVRMEKDAAARRLWLLARAETEPWPTVRQDALRLTRFRARQAPPAQAFFAGASGKWDRLREEAYGRTLNQSAIFALLPPSWVVADLGCGTGSLTAALAPHVAQVIGVDQSAAMLKAARARTSDRPNVDLRRGTLEALPIEDGACDAALLVLALSYVPDPASVVGEMARIVKPGGRAVVLDLLRHDREEFRLAMGQERLGFEPADLVFMMENAGFQAAAGRELTPEPGAKGPALILTTAERAGRARLRAVSVKEGERKR